MQDDSTTLHAIPVRPCLLSSLMTAAPMTPRRTAAAAAVFGTTPSPLRSPLASPLSSPQNTVARFGTLASPSARSAAAHVAAAADMMKPSALGASASTKVDVSLWQTALRRLPSGSPPPPSSAMRQRQQSRSAVVPRLPTPTHLTQPSPKPPPPAVRRVEATGLEIVEHKKRRHGAAAEKVKPTTLGKRKMHPTTDVNTTSPGRLSSSSSAKRQQLLDHNDGGASSSASHSSATSAAAEFAAKLAHDLATLQTLIVGEQKTPPDMHTTATGPASPTGNNGQPADNNNDDRPSSALFRVRHPVGEQQRLWQRSTAASLAVDRGDLYRLVKWIQLQYLHYSVELRDDTVGQGSCPAHIAFWARVLSRVRHRWGYEQEHNQPGLVIHKHEAETALQHVLDTWTTFTADTRPQSFHSTNPTSTSRDDTACLLRRQVECALATLRNRDVDDAGTATSGRQPLTRTDIYAALSACAQLAAEPSRSTGAPAESAVAAPADACCAAKAWCDTARRVLASVWFLRDRERAVSTWDVEQILALVTRWFEEQQPQHKHEQQPQHEPASIFSSYPEHDHPSRMISSVSEIWDLLPRLLWVMQKQPQRVLLAVEDDVLPAVSLGPGLGFSEHDDDDEDQTTQHARPLRPGGRLGGFAVLAPVAFDAAAHQWVPVPSLKPAITTATSTTATTTGGSNEEQRPLFQPADLLVECFLLDDSNTACDVMLLSHAARMAETRLLRRSEAEILADDNLLAHIQASSGVRVAVSAPSLWIHQPKSTIVRALEMFGFRPWLSAEAVGDRLGGAVNRHTAAPQQHTNNTAEWYRYEVVTGDPAASKLVRLVPSATFSSTPPVYGRALVQYTAESSSKQYWLL